MEGAAHQKWSLTQEAFNRLLAALGQDRDTAAHRYLEIRRNLVRLFEWRGCGTPDELADEAINRCAKKIGEGEEIRDIATYCIGIARMLLREFGRERARAAHPLEDVRGPWIGSPELEDDPERRLACLRQCLAQLTPENRDLILNYYQGEKGEKIRNRKRLTQLFGIPPNVLRMRALRLRERLRLCSDDCLATATARFAVQPGEAEL